MVILFIYLLETRDANNQLFRTNFLDIIWLLSAVG